MNFLQISYGPQIDNRMKFVQSVLQHVGEGDTYTLIADENRIEDERVNWIDAAEYEQMMQDRYEPIRRMWTECELQGNKVKYCDRADIIRVHYASENPDVFYCDTDVKLLEPNPEIIENKGRCYVISTLRSIQRIFDMEKKPCFGVRGVSGHLDDGLFYNGTRTDFFQSFFRWILGQEKLRRRQKFAWYAWYLRQPHVRKARVTGFFRHCYGT